MLVVREYIKQPNHGHASELVAAIPTATALPLSLSHSQKKKNKINILFMHRNPIPLKKSNQISPTPIKKEHSQGWPNLQVFLFPENLLCLFFIYFILHSACFQGKYGKVNENTIWVFFGGHEYDKNERAIYNKTEGPKFSDFIFFYYQASFFFFFFHWFWWILLSMWYIRIFMC